MQCKTDSGNAQVEGLFSLKARDGAAIGKQARHVPVLPQQLQALVSPVARTLSRVHLPASEELCVMQPGHSLVTYTSGHALAFCPSALSLWQDAQK